MEVKELLSPNFYSRSLYGIQYIPEIIVVHKTLGNKKGDLDWLTNPKSQASAHFHIARDGDIKLLVRLEYGAWHSGRIYKPNERARRVLKKHSWGQYVNPNKYSIGIECEALLNDKWTEKQMQSLVWLIDELGKEENKFNLKTPIMIDRQHVIDHQDIASYKPECDEWINEALRRITLKKTPPEDTHTKAVALLREAISLLER